MFYSSTKYTNTVVCDSHFLSGINTRHSSLATLRSSPLTCLPEDGDAFGVELLHEVIVHAFYRRRVGRRRGGGSSTSGASKGLEEAGGVGGAYTRVFNSRIYSNIPYKTRSDPSTVALTLPPLPAARPLACLGAHARFFAPPSRAALPLGSSTSKRAVRGRSRSSTF